MGLIRKAWKAGNALNKKVNPFYHLNKALGHPVKTAKRVHRKYSSTKWARGYRHAAKRAYTGAKRVNASYRRIRRRVARKIW